MPSPHQIAQRRPIAANRLIESINPKGRSTTYTYDALDRLLKRSDALGGTTQVSYDANDNPLTVVDANTHAIETNVYDLRNRLTRRTDATGKPTAYQYDANDNLVQATDRKGQVTTLQYDALNRPSQISDADGRITQYSYDLAGNLAHVSDSQSGDIVLNYDSLNRLTRIITNQGSVAYQYDALGRRTQRSLDGGDPTDYTYDKANRIKTLTYRGKTVTYNYDGAGRLIQKTLPNGITATYQYDVANRLTTLTYTKPDTTLLTALTYTYDANGNRISQNLNAPTDTPFSATYDAANRMLTYNGYPLTYDANGNLVQRQSAAGTVTYTWDARNRLTGISGPSGTASFKYDALGRRIEKTVNGQTVQYLYDGNQAIAELQGSAIGATYLTGLQIDEVLARYGASGDRTLIADALGSVLAQTDGTGVVQTQYSYSPYGETQTSGTNDGNPVQYTGRENDGTGLYYYRARYYDPQLKRFLSEDPIGLGGGVNQYAYVGNNPVNYTDPLGLAAAGPSGSNASAYPVPDTSMIVACALCTGLGILPPPPVGGYQGLTPNKPTDGGGDPLFGTQTSTPPSVGQKVIDFILKQPGDFISNVGNLIFNQGSGGPKAPNNPEPITNPPQQPPVPGSWNVVPNPQVPGGSIATPPGATPGDTSGENIRTSPPGSSPVPGLENGYWRWFRPGQGWYDPSRGKFGGGPGQTHIPLPSE